MANRARPADTGPGGLLPPGPSAPLELPASSGGWLPFAPVLLLLTFALFQAIRENNFQDFFIYRAGAVVGLRGESPYDADRLRPLIANQFPGDPLADNAGFFQAPAGLVLFAPFAALPYPLAKVAWSGVDALAAGGTILLLQTFAQRPGSLARPRSLVVLAVAVGLCLNFLTIAIVVVGQTTLLFVGCIAAGQFLFEKGRPWLGTLLWAVPFVKPHIALPLLPLAWFLGGWKRAAGLATLVGLSNLIGCLIVSGSPLFLKEYLDFLGSSHKSVEFNRAASNPQITSWNRIVIALHGPILELNAPTTVAGYLVWYLLLRALHGGRSLALACVALAASAAGSLVCCQVLGYEVFLLALAVPYLRDLFRAGRAAQPLAILALIALQMVPLDFEWIAGGAPRAFGVAGVAILVWLGPVAPSDCRADVRSA